jgi:GNAT superfamily N-acetyltransferase
VAGDGLVVRPAAAGDVDLVLDLLDEAARWMATIGRPNWPAPFPRERVVRDVGTGRLYLAAREATLVGTITFQWEDARFWGDNGTDGRAGYVHRLAVRRAHAGIGLGTQLLGWADQRVRAAGRTGLRLDVVSHNTPLRRYYERNGFAHVRDLSGEWVLADGSREEWCTSLYERAVS